MKRWYAVATRPHDEQRAAHNLRRQNYETWLPLRRKTRRRARRVETVRESLFPGYLFVHMDVNRQRWGPINNTFGVRRLIMRSDGPAPVEAGFVEGLRTVADPDGAIDETADVDLQVGESVRVVGGPFTDALGALLELKSDERVAVLLNFLGREVRTALPRKLVAAER